MSRPIIRVVDVSKRFVINKEKSLKERVVTLGRNRRYVEEFDALKNVSFELEPAKTLGLIGRNGSGKSTLLKVIGGILTPNTGYVERRGRLAALLELGAGFHGDLTGRENVFLNASILGLTQRQTRQYFDAIVEFSGIEHFIDTQVKFYSSGMYVRLAFAVAVHVDPEILLVDEVLAVGDEPFQRKCLDRIKQFQRDGRTIVLVTHGLDTVRQLCDRAIMLEQGNVVVDGTPVDALRAFRDRYQDVDVPPLSLGDKRMEILATRVTDADGRPKDRFRPGDALGIEFDVAVRQPVDEWVAGIAIENQIDTLVFGTNTEIERISLPPMQVGEFRVRFDFESIPMVEGNYYVTAAVHGPRGIPDYHRVNRVAAFRVFSDVGLAGVVHMEPQFRLLTREPVAAELVNRQ